MAKLLGTTYEELDKVLGSRESRTIGNNTVAHRYGAMIVVALHGHRIVELYPYRMVRVSNAGYATVTTRERINQFIRPMGWTMFQKGGGQYLRRHSDGVTVPYFSGDWWQAD